MLRVDNRVVSTHDASLHHGTHRLTQTVGDIGNSGVIEDKVEHMQAYSTDSHAKGSRRDALRRLIQPGGVSRSGVTSIS